VIREFLGAVEHTFIQKGKRHCEINLMFRMEIPSLSPERKPEACEHWISFKWIPLSGLGRIKNHSSSITRSGKQKKEAATTIP